MTMLLRSFGESGGADMAIGGGMIGMSASVGGAQLA